MIAHVQGTVAEKMITAVIIDVNGVGYEVQVPAGEYDSLQLHDTTKLYTYHHVREQAEELYGFDTLAGKRLFELLITVQGVGPKAALAILSLGNSEVVRSAIAAGDSGYIQGASGVGKRTADRVVVDLKDKVGIGGVHTIAAQSQQKDDALEAMMALGFTLRQATEALESVDATLSVEEKVRTALRQLAKQ